MRRARYLAGDDASSEAESALEWMCRPAIPTQTCAPARQAGCARTTAWTTKCNALPSARLVASLRLGVQSTTGDHHDQQVKKEGKQESKQAGGVCGGTPDYDGKIKEAAQLCAKPRARLTF
jgi:hypothetical protein